MHLSRSVICVYASSWVSDRHLTPRMHLYHLMTPYSVMDPHKPGGLILSILYVVSTSLGNFSYGLSGNS